MAALMQGLSYQRRVLAQRTEVMVRNEKSPFGIVFDYCDRSIKLFKYNYIS